MESKYYTPEIEELFCHLINEGVLYSKVAGDEGWKSFLYEADNIPVLVKSFIEMNDYNTQIGYDVNEDLYRLKLLDQEDIESLGFEKSVVMIKSFIHPTEFIGIQLWQGEVVLYNNFGMFDRQEQVFKGTIKNKSELKKILKQIGYGV